MINLDIEDLQKEVQQGQAEYFCVQTCDFNRQLWEENSFYFEDTFEKGLTEFNRKDPIPRYMIPVKGEATEEQKQLLTTRIYELDASRRMLMEQMKNKKIRGAESAITDLHALLTRLLQVECVKQSEGDGDPEKPEKPVPTVARTPAKPNK